MRALAEHGSGLKVNNSQRYNGLLAGNRVSCCFFETPELSLLNHRSIIYNPQQEDHVSLVVDKVTPQLATRDKFCTKDDLLYYKVYLQKAR